ncbi:hypothetical protein HY990_07060 [Candidatus Micrarchaeota archaeon]|nr:hypothetical protein [Candidatus Micrarchaeota archaeon]
MDKGGIKSLKNPDSRAEPKRAEEPLRRQQLAFSRFVPSALGLAVILSGAPAIANPPQIARTPITTNWSGGTCTIDNSRLIYTDRKGHSARTYLAFAPIAPTRVMCSGTYSVILETNGDVIVAVGAQEVFAQGVNAIISTRMRGLNVGNSYLLPAPITNIDPANATLRGTTLRINSVGTGDTYTLDVSNPVKWSQQ